MDTSHAEQHADRQTVYYRNLQDAVGWLTENFGLEELENGHSAADNGVITLQLGATEVDVCQIPPTESGQSPGDSRLENQSCYVLVADIETAWAFLSSTKAPLVFDNPPDEEHERSFGVRDPEGVIWFFGSSAKLPPQALPSQPEKSNRSGAFLATVAALGVGLAAAGLYFGYTHMAEQQQQAARQAKLDQERLQRVERQLRAAQSIIAHSKAAADRARQELERQRQIQLSSENAIAIARRQIALEQSERRQAELRAQEMATKLQKRQAAESTASLADDEAEIQLGHSKALRMAAEQEARQSKSLAIRARAQREASEAKVKSLSEDLLRHQQLQRSAATKIAVLVRDLAREKESRRKAERALNAVRSNLARETDPQPQSTQSEHEQTPTTKMTSTSAGENQTEAWPITGPIIAPQKQLPVSPAPVTSPDAKKKVKTEPRSKSQARRGGVRRATRPNRNRTNSTTARFRTRPRL